MPGKRGHPPHQYSRETASKIEIMVAAGLTQERIAKVIGIARSTLQNHYKEPLSVGRDKALANNTVSLFNAARQGNVTAMIYIQKCIGGAEWKERAAAEHTGEVKISVTYGDRD